MHTRARACTHAHAHAHTEIEPDRGHRDKEEEESYHDECLPGRRLSYDDEDLRRNAFDAGKVFAFDAADSAVAADVAEQVGVLHPLTVGGHKPKQREHGDALMRVSVG